MVQVDVVHQDPFLRALLFDADRDPGPNNAFGPFLADLIGESVPARVLVSLRVHACG